MTGSPHFQGTINQLVFGLEFRVRQTLRQVETLLRTGQTPTPAQSVNTTEFVTLTVTHFVEQLLKVLHSFAFWN